MNNNDSDILESLVAGGLIGAALGVLLSKGKEEGAAIGALAGAVILATYKANEQALKANLPVYVEENGKLYEIQQGDKKFIKDIPKQNILLPKNFKLK